jgi:flagellar biosynthesis activator protein FlaF
MRHAAQAYGNVARETSRPRELEAMLLLKAAARFQAIRDSWDQCKSDLDGALLYNRKLWTIFVSAVSNDEHPLPIAVRQNVKALGTFVFNRTMRLNGDPRPEALGSLIDINREIATGLLGRG